MDVIVTPDATAEAWTLADLLGRSMGRVIETAPDVFLIEPDGSAIETMAGMAKGPFRTLDAALAAVETHTRGVCRRNPGEDAG